VRLRPYM